MKLKFTALNTHTPRLVSFWSWHQHRAPCPFPMDSAYYQSQKQHKITICHNKLLVLIISFFDLILYSDDIVVSLLLTLEKQKSLYSSRLTLPVCPCVPRTHKTLRFLKGPTWYQLGPFSFHASKNAMLSFLLVTIIKAIVIKFRFTINKGYLFSCQRERVKLNSCILSIFCCKLRIR